MRRPYVSATAGRCALVVLFVALTVGQCSCPFESDLPQHDKSNDLEATGTGERTFCAVTRLAGGAQ